MGQCRQDEGITQTPHHGEGLPKQEPFATFAFCPQLDTGTRSIMSQSLECMSHAAIIMEDQAKVLEPGRLRKDLTANPPSAGKAWAIEISSAFTKDDSRRAICQM